MNYHHQLQLLVDILHNQQDENYGSHDEFEQMEHLISNMLENNEVPDEVKAALMSLEQFSYQHDKEGMQSNFTSTEIQQYLRKLENFVSK
ncbi:YtzH-like family protein [Evansella sp. AB-rgal1]|uniref:YtzH-like family protein n=1 Tax=Evansella sp. AB-rgal1 TaxID=3242696 RepID=UPI00359DD3A1